MRGVEYEGLLDHNIWYSQAAAPPMGSRQGKGVTIAAGTQESS